MREIGPYRTRNRDKRLFLSFEFVSKLKALGVKKVSGEVRVPYETLSKYLNQDNRVDIQAEWLTKMGSMVGLPREKWFEEGV